MDHFNPPGDAVVLDEEPVDGDGSEGAGGEVRDVVVLEDEDVDEVDALPQRDHRLRDATHHAVDASAEGMRHLVRVGFNILP